MIPKLQPHTLYGRFALSVQASSRHYCSPRRDLENFEDYDSYEVACWEGSGPMTAPSAFGIQGLDEYWGTDSVGSCVPKEAVARLHKKFKELADLNAREQKPSEPQPTQITLTPEEVEFLKQVLAPNSGPYWDDNEEDKQLAKSITDKLE